METSRPHRTYWVVTRNFYPSWAGPSERFFRYARTSIDTPLKFEFRTIAGEGPDTGEIQEIRYQRLPVTNSRDLHWKVLWTILTLSGDRPDGLIYIDPGWENILINRLLRLWNVKSIYVSTMDFDLHHRANGAPRKGWYLRMFRTYFRILMNSFHFIVSSSAFLSNHYQQVGIRTGKLRVIHNGIDLNRFGQRLDADLRKSLRRSLGLPQEEFIFLFVGLMNDRKGVLELLSGWRVFKEKGGRGTLVLVGSEKRGGPGSQEFFEIFDRWKPDFEDKLQVIFHPPSHQIQDYYQACDTFVFLSKLEGMPNVLWEAMASGLPILLHKFVGFSDVYGAEGFNYIATSLDSEEIAGHLMEIQTNETLRKSLSKNVRQLAQNYSVHRSVEEYAKLIEGNRDK